MNRRAWSTVSCVRATFMAGARYNWSARSTDELAQRPCDHGVFRAYCSSRASLASSGIEPPTRFPKVRWSARASRRPGRDFRWADRTAPPDRAHPEPEPGFSVRRSGRPMPVNGLGASRPSLFRTPRRTWPPGSGVTLDDAFPARATVVARKATVHFRPRLCENAGANRLIARTGGMA